MLNLTLAQIANVVGGKLFGDESILVENLSTDSREVRPKSLFAAIVGSRVDAHEKVTEALASGAVATICTKPVSENYVLLEAQPEVSIDPVIPALGKLAKYVRNLQKDLVVVGITGSSGKTSTKDLIGQVLSAAGPTYTPSGSLNNELGLPQIILQAPADTKYLPAEMGMRGLGHISYLADIAKPNIAVITNIGHAHVGELGSIENIVQAKSELIKALPDSGIAILNHDDPNVRDMSKLTKAKIITYGLGSHADVRAENLHSLADGTTKFKLVFKDKSIDISLPLLGEHNVSNALAACATGIAIGMSIDDIANVLISVKTKSNWRMEVSHLPNNITIINDAYNANPESMTAALKTLASIKTSGKHWAILGAMHELGSDAVQLHDAIGRLAVRLNIEQLVVVGQEAKTLHLGAQQEGSWDGETEWLPNFSEACDYICKKVQVNDVLLFKASRSEEFDRLAKLVADELMTKGEKLA